MDATTLKLRSRMEAGGESLPYHCHLHGMFQHKRHEHVAKRALIESQLWAWGEPMLDVLDLAGCSGVSVTEVLGMHDFELHSKLREAATAFRETKYRALRLEAALEAAYSKKKLLQARIAELESKLQQVQQLLQRELATVSTQVELAPVCSASTQVELAPVCSVSTQVQLHEALTAAPAAAPSSTRAGNKGARGGGDIRPYDSCTYGTKAQDDVKVPVWCLTFAYNIRIG
ncbi:hypothetical protein JKP88DRAFT_354509 [Tribonema minus]|uniref:Uncharacterized protein n=1 Tax=Tribonema minus TaxID=303371 RepID=A0A835YSF1_9STRA|nr:hypothetical protein JKP88DRAFT_354707 [Tribonema minus]KAG5184195.1 hypothetical protein JKP88DRAFT_354509 [Tribonema minus]